MSDPRKLYSPLHNSWRPFIWKWWKHWLSPSTYWDTLVVSYQRATRGWAYCDTWSLDGYLCDVMIPALEHLKRTKHGVPVPDDPVYTNPETCETSEEEFARWQRVFDSELDAMIAGFRAAEAVIELECPDVASYPEWVKEQNAIRERGFDSFKKHFFSLWD